MITPITGRSLTVSADTDGGNEVAQHNSTCSVALFRQHDRDEEPSSSNRSYSTYDQ